MIRRARTVSFTGGNIGIGSPIKPQIGIAIIISALTAIVIIPFYSTSLAVIVARSVDMSHINVVGSLIDNVIISSARILV